MFSSLKGELAAINRWYRNDSVSHVSRCDSDKCNFNQAHVGVYAKQQTSEYMVVKVRSDVLYNAVGRFEVSVVSNHFNGNWSAAAPELLRAPTHATCTPIDW